MKVVLPFLFLCSSVFCWSQKIKPHINSSQPISFQENKGQIHDQNYKPRPDVLFSGNAGGMAFHLRNNGISYQLYRVDKYKEVKDIKTREKRKEIELQTIYRTDIKWLNANPLPNIKTDQTLPGVTNYYLEQCPNGVMNVKSYKGITFQNIYSNIDLHYYEKKGNLKCDYIVAPHADYKQIQLKVDGAKLTLQKDGGLLMETPIGKIREQAPLVYQEGKQLKARYNITNNIISFEIDNYNSNYELIIDPITRVWGTYYGGAGGIGDFVQSCTTEASGNVYITGYTDANTGTVIATVGSHQSISGGNQDAYLVKFNSSGVRLWGTYYGGIGDDRGYSCANDIFGNIYMAGFTGTSTGTVIATAASHQTVFNGPNDDAFLVKFNSSGVRIWGTYYGGVMDDFGYSCSCDASGNVYMAGSTQSPDAIASPGCHQGSIAGGNDGFLVKFDSLGVRQWGTYYGGSGNNDYGQGCATDASGNVYMTGYTDTNTGTVIATAASQQSVYAGGTYDAYLVKFDSLGVRQWGTYYGGPGYDFGLSCISDVLGNVYMTGATGGGTGTVIVTAGCHQSLYGGGTGDALLVKFNTNGVRQWGTYYGGSGNIDDGYSLASDASGNVYIGGLTSSSSGIATAGSHQSAFGGGSYDAFLAKFNSGGVRLWGTYYGGTGSNEGGYGCASDGFGNIYLAGFSDTNSGTVIATIGAFQSTYGGGINDGFLVKFTCSALSQPSVISGTVSVCTGASQTYSVANDPFATYYSWSLPGGWSGSSSTNTITAIAGATGILTVTANDGCGSSPQRTFAITVNPLPAITVGSGSICTGGSFTISPGGANTYTIQGGSAVVSPTANSSYTVVGTSSLGCASASFATANVTVNATPMPTITANSGSICLGNSFTITPAGAFTYTFSPSGPVVSPTVNTMYSVVGTSTNGCISNTVSLFVSLYPAVTVTISSSSNSICATKPVTLTASGANSYTWNTAATTTAIVDAPVTNTVYSVSGTNVNGCLGTQTFAVMVYPLPTIAISGSSSLCISQSLTLTASGANTFTWNSGPQTSSLSITPTVNTTYTVIGSSINGCTSTAAQAVTVYAYPNVTVSANPTTVCNGQTVSLTAGTATSYSWSNGGTTSITSVVPNATSVYTVNAYNAAGCSVSKTITVNVIASPTVNVNSTQNPLCLGQTATITATGATTYSWNNFSFNYFITTSPTVNTTYTVTGMSPNGCWHSVAVTQSVVSCTDVGELRDTRSVFVYPNPAMDELKIKSMAISGNTKIILCNSIGQLVKVQNLNEKETSVDISQFAKGMYLLSIVDSNNLVLYSTKLIKN
jgi:hypothetical protein